MAYTRSNLISRRGYSGMPNSFSGIIHGGLGGITDFLKGVLNSYGAAQQQQGALTQAQLDAQQKAATSGGDGLLSVTNVAIVGAVGLAAFLLLRKKKS